MKDIFPDVFVSGYYIHPFGSDDGNKLADLEVPLPKIARDFVKFFDSLSAIPGFRLTLPEFEFEISIPDEIIAEINIEEVRNLGFQQAIYLLIEGKKRVDGNSLLLYKWAFRLIRVPARWWC